MKFVQVFAFCVVVALVMAAFAPQETEAGKKKMLKKLALAALLAGAGKKILIPLPIPIPIPILKQTQPIYYPQPSYPSYPSYPSSGGYGGY